ncbi:MAG: hypothetical protein PGMFKBFP_01100 [Anaerolineales bacterium]|nr:hypothetical protein [Anaerolineales bacterium]
MVWIVGLEKIVWGIRLIKTTSVQIPTPQTMALRVLVHIVVAKVMVKIIVVGRRADTEELMIAHLQNQSIALEGLVILNIKAYFILQISLLIQLLHM